MKYDEIDYQIPANQSTNKTIPPTTTPTSGGTTNPSKCNNTSCPTNYMYNNSTGKCNYIF
jgi:hypothetical protein